jgi:hypothetical protein
MRPPTGRAIAYGETQAAHSVCSPPPCGEGLGVGVHLQTKKETKAPPPPTPPHTRSASALLAGEGEHGGVRFTISAQMR